MKLPTAIFSRINYNNITTISFITMLLFYQKYNLFLYYFQYNILENFKRIIVSFIILIIALLNKLLFNIWISSYVFYSLISFDVLLKWFY